jgi:hypothetical protein
MATQTATNVFGRNCPEAKVAIITGGDEGIDRAIASRLAAEGADIAFFAAAAVIAAARNKWVYLKGTEEVTRAGLLERQHHSNQQIGQPPRTRLPKPSSSSRPTILI